MEKTLLADVSLHDKNWFGTGGEARFYCEPITEEEFAKSLLFAQENNLALFVLGQGANILISDDGFDGLVIRPKLKKINIEGELVSVQAGVDIQELIKTCLANNLSGLEEFSGIPGTVGGSVFINIHYFEFLLSQFILHAKVINKASGKVEVVNKEWFNFGYNISTLHKKDFFLIEATFKLQKTDSLTTAYNKGRMAEIVRHRSKRYPTEKTCGSFFRNFLKEELSEGQLPYAAYYLDKIGAKGNLSLGGASVSHLHANMIVNKGNATSNNIISIARKMQELVLEKFGLLLKPECRLVGFKNYPLHKPLIKKQSKNMFDHHTK